MGKEEAVTEGSIGECVYRFHHLLPLDLRPLSHFVPDNVLALTFPICKERTTPLIRTSIYCQQQLDWGLGMLWQKMRKHALRLKHLKHLLNGKNLRSQLLKRDILQLVTLMELQSLVSIDQERALNTWNATKHHSFLPVGQSIRWKYDYGSSIGG